MPASPENRPPVLRILCDEPYRVFFPLAVLSGFIGVSHWLWYYAGLTQTYSCNYHALFQIQGFETAFALGFLMTALPRFLEVPGARPWELLLAVGLYAWSIAELYLEHWARSETLFLLLILHLLFFIARRFLRRRDNPPHEFLFIPFGLLHALLGGLLILYPLPGFVKLGQRTVEQGMFLSFIMGIGPYLGSRLMGLASERRDIRRPGRVRLTVHALAGLTLLLSFWVESGPSEQAGKLLRALTVSAHILWTVPIYRLPARPLWHLRLLWCSFWCLILGLWPAALFPDYEILSLHIMFIGGFGLLTVLIATRVIVAHCGFEHLWEDNLKTFAVFGFFLLLALIARVISDFFPTYYFGMLHNAAGFWLLALLIWAAVFIPKLSPKNIADE